MYGFLFFFFFQAEDGIRDLYVTGVQTCALPICAPDAGRLLDAQPRPPRGRAREQVLAQAAGNPMALIELSRVIAVNPAAGRRWAAEPLPPTERLAAVIAGLYGTL